MNLIVWWWCWRAGPSHPKPPETVVIDQRNMRFDPDLVVVPVGSTVQFPNCGPDFPQYLLSFENSAV